MFGFGYSHSYDPSVDWLERYNPNGFGARLGVNNFPNPIWESQPRMNLEFNPYLNVNQSYGYYDSSLFNYPVQNYYWFNFSGPSHHNKHKSFNFFEPSHCNKHNHHH